jgi:hypothetical protein
METELSKLSQSELHRIRAWLDEIIEDELEFTPEFEAKVQESEKQMASGQQPRVRKPESR